MARPRWPGRQRLVWLHRWAGLVLALFLVLAGLSGSALAFKEDLDAWLNPDLFRAAPGLSQPLDALIAAVERGDSRARVSRVLYPTPERDTMLLGVVARDGAGVLDYDDVFVDPVTAQVLGQRDSAGCCLSARLLMPFLFRFHYTLAAGQIGQWLMGGMALLWTLDCFVGLWLTFPRVRPFLARWWPIWKIKPTRNSFRLTLDLHRAGGLWCWMLLLVMAVSGVALNLRSEVFEPVVSTLLPTSPSVFEQARTLPPMAAASALSFGAAADRAVASERGKVAVFAYYVPSVGVYGIGLQDRDRGAEHGLGPDMIYVDGRNGAILRSDQAGKGPLGDLVMQAQYPLHSGQIIGLTGRIAICVLGVVVAMLAVTGVYVWWRKRAGRRARRHAPADRRPV